jgi:arginine-tRNA-protein transferase
LRRNADLVVSACRPWSTTEQYDLLSHYLSARHPDGGMANMDDMDYADMVEQSPVRSQVIEYRTPPRFGRTGELVGACLTDQQSDGMSMIYSFYNPEIAGRPSLGNFIIMNHILRAKAAGLPYVYLGYWVNGAARMHYKTLYRPLERLGPDGWECFDPDAETV